MVFAHREEIDLTSRSSYLKYLPAIYSDNDFMGRFLMIFEHVLGPIESILDNLSYYFDPGTIPQELLPWLASWVNLVLDDTWPLERRRELVKSAVALYQLRGTRRGVKEYIQAYTGVEPTIDEDFAGLILGESAQLGRNTVLGGGGGQYTFTVTLELEDPDSVELGQLRTIIEEEKPAHTSYTLRIVPKNPQNEG